jgi:LPXTG-site transpeptidase (sortase) family protein
VAGAAALLLLPAVGGSAHADGWYQDPGAPDAAPATAPEAAPVVMDAQPLQTVAPIAGPLPITALRIPSVAIDTPVVEAPLIEDADGSISWDVPSFVAGHAEMTGSAGAPGNAVVFGHVTSLTLGNVFEHLHAANIGDEVDVYSGNSVFAYRVVDVASLSRTDMSILYPADRPVITLVTCTGLWNPFLRDYMQRLVVRAELPT